MKDDFSSTVPLRVVYLRVRWGEWEMRDSCEGTQARAFVNSLNSQTGGLVVAVKRRPVDREALFLGLAVVIAGGRAVCIEKHDSLPFARISIGMEWNRPRAIGDMQT
jgi:hypothetical protein